jgi:predicted type IV restriction endonuclease
LPTFLISIHLLQLPKWQSNKTITTEKDRWIYLFKEGRNVDLDNPPETLNTEEMRQVMNVLHRFSENETNYLLYQSRLDAVLKENTYLHELEEARKGMEQEKKAKERLQERLNNLLLNLKKKGIDPEDV